MKLDIVIPTRNRLDRLAECLVSVHEAIKKLDNVYFKIKVFVDSV